MRKSGIFLCFALLLAISSGCTSPGTTTAAAPRPTPLITSVPTPVPTSVPTPVSYDNNKTCRDTYGTSRYYNVVTNRCDLPPPGDTPTPTGALAQDPIIGVWRLSNSTGYDDRYRFNADGTYTESFFYTVYYGTWSAQGGNSYVIRDTATGDYETFIYSPVQNAIYSTKYPSLLLTPFEGNVMAASPSSPPPSLPSYKSLYNNCNSLGYCYSGYGDGVVHFTTYWGDGLTTFTMNYTGQSNFVVILEDETRNYLSLLVNEFGPYFGKKSELLAPTDGRYIPSSANGIGPYSGNAVEILRPTTTRKYILDVRASGPWTIEITHA